MISHFVILVAIGTRDCCSVFQKISLFFSSIFPRLGLCYMSKMLERDEDGTLSAFSFALAHYVNCGYKYLTNFGDLFFLGCFSYIGRWMRWGWRNLLPYSSFSLAHYVNHYVNRYKDFGGLWFFDDLPFQKTTRLSIEWRLLSQRVAGWAVVGSFEGNLYLVWLCLLRARHKYVDIGALCILFWCLRALLVVLEYTSVRYLDPNWVNTNLRMHDVRWFWALRFSATWPSSNKWLLQVLQPYLNELILFWLEGCNPIQMFFCSEEWSNSLITQPSVRFLGLMLSCPRSDLFFNLGSLNKARLARFMMRRIRREWLLNFGSLNKVRLAKQERVLSLPNMGMQALQDR